MIKTIEIENALGTITAAITLPIIWAACAAIAIVSAPVLFVWWIQHKIDWPNGWVT